MANPIAEARGEGRCPRCGNFGPLGQYAVCTPCAAAEGWDPSCRACLAENAGLENVAALQHVATCDGGKTASAPAGRPPLTAEDIRYLLGSINDALLNGRYMTSANIAFETLCDHLGEDREALPFDLERSREVFVRRFDVDAPADALRLARVARDEAAKPAERPAPVGSWWRQSDGAIVQVDGDYLDGPGDQIVTYTEYRPDASTARGKWGGKELAAAYTRIEAHEVPDWVEVAW